MEETASGKNQESGQHTEPTQKATSVPGSKSFFKSPIFYAIFLILILVAAGSMLFVKQKPTNQQDPKTIEYTTGGKLDSVVVHIPNETIDRYPLTEFTLASGFVWPNTFEGLTVFRGINLEPGLAESWTNPNPTTWRIKLRKGVKFHSGEPFTANDVKYTFDTAKASEKDEVPWVIQPYAARVDSVNIIDDYTVDLKTKAPDPTLLYGLVWVGMVSKGQIAKDGVNKAVGTGPYKIISITKDEAKLEANDEYWGGTPKVKKVTYKVVDDTDQAKEAFKNGALDLILLNTLHNDDLVKQGHEFKNVRIGNIVYLTFDVNSAKTKYVTGVDTNPFKDKRVRKAIQLALDFNKIIEASGNNAEPVTQFVTQELVGFNPQLTGSKRDLTEAKRLMAEAGFQDGFSVTIDADEKADHPRILAEVKKELAEIGITVKPNIIETDPLYEKFFATDFSLLLTDIYPDTLDSLNFIDQIFHTPTGSHGLYNGSKYSNPEIDAILDQAESTFDVDKRIELTHQAHALTMEEVPAIPLFTEDYQIFARDDITYNPSISALIFGFDISGRQKSK